MAKLFEKKEKKQEYKNGMRALTPEETERADKLKAPRHELIAAMRAMGCSEAEIKAVFPDPLPESEQQDILMELRKMFGEHRYQDVIDTFKTKVTSGLLTGSVAEEAVFAVGFSGVMTKNKELIEDYGNATVSFLLKSVKSENAINLLHTVRVVMRLAEAELPGCMKMSARKLYPAMCNAIGADNEMTLEVKSYM
ncbi:MAG TPA: hypothetical protein PKA81_14485 [Clostridia bacterium]|nr:hypothetical protein [Clostridia bacterium]